MGLKKEEEKIKGEVVKILDDIKGYNDNELKEYHKKATLEEKAEAVKVAEEEMERRGIYW